MAEFANATEAVASQGYKGTIIFNNDDVCAFTHMGTKENADTEFVSILFRDKGKWRRAVTGVHHGGGIDALSFPCDTPDSLKKCSEALVEHYSVVA